MTATATLTDRIDAALPQTQCRRCGYDDCRSYAQAVAQGAALINRCPPGGAEGIGRLARITGLPVLPLDESCGAEEPRRIARIDEAWCIGCTLCIKACPVDCIVGAPKAMHGIVESQCTGCELCLPACPVDCIDMLPASGERTGWQAWSAQQADAARERYRRHRVRSAGSSAVAEVAGEAAASGAAQGGAMESAVASAHGRPPSRTDLVAAALARVRSRAS